MSDMDGACSAAIMYLFCNEGRIVPKVYFHTSKQHGINDVMQNVIDDNINLLIVPDAGSNDVNECKELKSHGIDVLVLDHHEIDKDNPYAVVVNHHLDKNLNTALSGAGVAYKFVQAFFNDVGIEPPDYNDLVAVSLISDICDLSALENRAFINKGLNNHKNPFLIYAFEKCCKYRGVTPEGVGWDIAPLCNALARADEQESKALFFNALIGCIDYEDALKEMRRIKRLQDTAVKEVVSQIEPTLDCGHKAIIGFSDASNKSYLGLIANKFCGKHNKPTFLLRELNSTTWAGSMRSPIDLAGKINDSGLAQAQGHEAACGITVKKANLKRFARWLDGLDLDARPPIPVTACISPEIIDISFAKSIENNKILYGQGVYIPQFYMRLNLKKDNVFVYKKNMTTLKIQVGDLSILKFFASENDVNAFMEHDEFELECIVNNLATNEYDGKVTPQCNLVEYEIHPVENEPFDFDNLFQ